MIETRQPRIFDRVLLWGESGTIVEHRAGIVVVDGDDQLRVTVPVDRLRWDPLGAVWLIVTEDDEMPVAPDADEWTEPELREAWGR
jgi:hypothetical protein